MNKNWILSITVFCLVGCAAPPKIKQSQMEIQAYQSREFETTKRIAFDSTMSVLQDAGYIVESADYETGFVTGKGTSQSGTSFWYGATNEHTKMTAFIEQRTSSLSRIRINIVESKQRKSYWNPAQDIIDEAGVRDPEVYQKLFEQIDQAIFIKKNL